MFVFRKIWRALFSRNTRYEIRTFALLPTNTTYIRDSFFKSIIDQVIPQANLNHRGSAN